MSKNLIVVSAPSGAGKTTICRELQRRRPGWRFSVSCTTRPKRNYEKAGYDYEFISEDEFRRRVQEDELVEHEEIHGYLYGTPRSNVEGAIRNGEVLLLELGVLGGIAIKDAYPHHTTTIFIRPPSLNELKRRLRKRGSDSEERIATRLKRMEMEMGCESQYDFSVVNENISMTVEEILSRLENQNGGKRNGD